MNFVYDPRERIHAPGARDPSGLLYGPAPGGFTGLPGSSIPVRTLPSGEGLAYNPAALNVPAALQISPGSITGIQNIGAAPQINLPAAPCINCGGPPPPSGPMLPPPASPPPPGLPPPPASQPGETPGGGIPYLGQMTEEGGFIEYGQPGGGQPGSAQETQQAIQQFRQQQASERATMSTLENQILEQCNKCQQAQQVAQEICASCSTLQQLRDKMTRQDVCKACAAAQGPQQPAFQIPTTPGG